MDGPVEGAYRFPLINVWKSSRFPLINVWAEHKSVKLASVASWDLVLDYFSTLLLRQFPTLPKLHSHLFPPYSSNAP